MNVIYLARKPVYASWALEYPEGSAVVFFQVNEQVIRIIGSMQWDAFTLSSALDEMSDYFPWTPRHHLVPDSDSWQRIFDQQHLHPVRVAMPPADVYIAITRQYLSQMLIDTQSRPWTSSEENNLEFRDALNNYKFIETAGDGLSSSVAHTQEVFYARALERLAVWSFTESKREWSPAPNYEEQDKAII